jgi:hypothetical protein
VIGRGQPDHHAERGRFAGAVRAQQTYDFAGRDLQVDVLDDHTAAVGLGELLGAKDGHLFAAALQGHGTRLFGGRARGLTDAELLDLLSLPIDFHILAGVHVTLSPAQRPSATSPAPGCRPFPAAHRHRSTRHRQACC